MMGGSIVSKTNSFRFYQWSTTTALLIGYCAYYLCRQNMSAAFPILEKHGVTLVQFGMLSSVGTLVYAIGKVITGSFADGKGGQGKPVFFVGLFGSAIATLAFGFSSGFILFLIFWTINRTFQSMGWAGLVNILPRWVQKKNYGTVMGIMSLSYQIGGVVATLFAGLLISLSPTKESLFIIPAVTMLVIGFILRPLVVNRPEDIGLQSIQNHVHPSTEGSKNGHTYFQRFRVLLGNPMFLVVCILSLCLTFMREVFSFWMPLFFSELGAKASVAAYKSAVFPLLGCFGTFVAGWFSDRFLAGKRASIMAFMITGLALTMLALSNLGVVANTLSFISKEQIAFVLVGLAGFFLLAPYSFVGGGVVALDFGGHETAATAAGLLDGVGYLGATFAGIGLAKLVSISGWASAYSLMLGLSVVCLLLCFVVWKAAK